MTRSAAGVDYNPFQFFQRLVLTRPREVYYIGGSDVLPAPLEPRREAYVISKLDTDQHQEAKAILIEHNLRLVAHIIKKYYGNQSEQDDLVSIGTIGLIKAINTYDISKKIKLSSYASRCIENEILMHFRNAKKTAQDISLNEAIDSDKDGNPLTLLDIMAVDDNILEQIDFQLNSKKLSQFINEELSPREKMIIVMRYGLDGSEPLTQKKIAQKLNISRSYVSRIETKALKLSRLFSKYPLQSR